MKLCLWKGTPRCPAAQSLHTNLSFCSLFMCVRLNTGCERWKISWHHPRANLHQIETQSNQLFATAVTTLQADCFQAIFSLSLVTAVVYKPFYLIWCFSFQITY